MLSHLMLASSFLLTSCAHNVKPETTAPVRVSVQPVTYHNSTIGSLFSGTVEAESTSNISFSVPGTITHIYVSEGQRVHKGQILASIRSNDYINANNIAQAELAEAQDAYNRLKKLHDADALPDIKWVEVQNKLQQAQSAANIAAQSVSDATLRAPYDGVISKK